MNPLISKKYQRLSVSIELDSLYPSAMYIPSSLTYRSTKEDIEKSGLLYPVVVADSLVKMEIYFPSHRRYFEDAREKNIPYVVMCGNNRVVIAKQLNYTHISCYIANSFEECNIMCGEMRKYWKQHLKSLK